MGNLRVQEHIQRSNRYHLSLRAFDNIRSAYIEMRARSGNQWREYGHYNEAELYVNDAKKETDNETYIDVVSPGGARRRFTLVMERGGEPVPFGHLLKRRE